MLPFTYSIQNMHHLERALSPERLLPYLKSASGDVELALHLYEQNTLLAESLYGVLQGLEITLRNVTHSVLSAGFGKADWWNTLHMQPDQAAMVAQAKDRLIRAGKATGPGRIVSELSFGFWTGLTGPKYDVLWRNHLTKIIPRRPMQRPMVQTRLNSIRKLRNRVAHHEPILSRPLQKDVNQIFDTISWMSPTAAHWIRSTSSFEERFKAYQIHFQNIQIQKP